MFNFCQATAVHALRTFNQFSQIDAFHETSDTILEILAKAIYVPRRLPSVAKNFVFIKKVLVTPTRLIFRDPVPVAKNRVLRQFTEDNTFLLVEYVDEEGQSLRGGDTALMENMRNTMVYPSDFFILA